MDGLPPSGYPPVEKGVWTEFWGIINSKRQRKNFGKIS
jgi:hypothetical protein